jgi:predicted AAA+ superfamily ATPase
MEKWISPHTITGPPAEQSYYFHRTDIEKEFWRRVKSGSHILFLAPRRVGKTSIMKFIEAHPAEGYICFYENIQSVKNKAELFQRIFEMILKCAGNRDKAKNWISRVVKQFGIKEITKSVIKF